MTAQINAQRQKRWRERHKTGDLFPPHGHGEKAPFDTPQAVTTVTPAPVTPGGIGRHLIQVSEHGTPRTELHAVRPCPFCGGLPYAAIGHGGKGLYITVGCSECSAIAPYAGPVHTLESALAAWNRRTGA